MTSKTKPQAAGSMVHEVESGSGNAFSDLNFPDPEERQLRAQWAVRLNDRLAVEGLIQAAAAKRMDIARPQVPELKHYKLGRFSREGLLHSITLSNRDADTLIQPCIRSANQHASTGAGTVWSTT